MTERRHGPDLRIPVVPLMNCCVCKGRGVERGVFHEMACMRCGGAGVLDGKTGEAMSLDAAVLQLRLRLTSAHTEVMLLRERLRRAGLEGAATDYQAPAGAWTGD